MSYQFSLTPRKVPLVKTKNREIKTEIPNPSTVEIIKGCIENEPFSMNDQLPVVWDKAIDYKVFDSSGNCWIDFTSTIFVANVGHSNPEVVKAIHSAVEGSLLNAYYYQTGYREELVKSLLQAVPKNLKRVFLLTTGAEATEATMKTAMNFGRKIRESKDIIVGFEGSFHGKTMGAQTLGGKPGGKKWVKYFHPRIIHLDYPYPWVLEKAKMTGEQFFYDNLKKLEAAGINLKDIAAIFAEPYQGWCSVFFPRDYMQAVRKWTKENDSLLGFDEVQSGFGRTGKMFGFEYFGVDPDVIWCGKAISGSLPVSAVIAREDFFGDDGSLNSTHGGNPVGVAASVASLNYIKSHDLVKESERKGFLVEGLLKKWNLF